MIENVTAYFHELKQLSNRALDASAQSMALKEKRYTAGLIAHLAEISARKYHLHLGYKSLFEYACRRLNLSEGSVYRRIQVARVCNRFPQILAALAGGQMNLTAAGLIAPHITTDNVDTLINKIQGKSKQAIKAVLASLAPKEQFKPSIRKLPAPSVKQETITARNDTVRSPKEGTVPPQPEAKMQSHIFEPATCDLYNFRFSAGKAFTGKFDRLAEVLGIEVPQKHMANVLEKALDIALDKVDPQRKSARRKKRQAKPCPGDARKKAKPPKAKEIISQCVDEKRLAPTPEKANDSSRYIAVDVRERVFERAGYRCEYCGPDGMRCSARTGLQIEHTRPFAVYRSHEEGFLKAFCRPHNLLMAEKYFGQAFIMNKIEARRRLQPVYAEVRQMVEKQVEARGLPPPDSR